jgi:ribonuclease BN (tRNA processing enzyme)
MKIRLLGCIDSGGRHDQFLTSYLVGDTVAVDAGSLGFAIPVEEQSRVRHVFLTHSHLDHLASLPIFVENAYRGVPECVVIHGGPAVLESVRTDLFNDRLWPDFLRLGRPEAPFLRLEPVENGRTLTADGLRITPVEVDHIVPSHGYLFEDASASVLIVSDTGPTREIWERARGLSRLDAVFLPVALPESMQEMARIARHLVPSDVPGELAKLGKPTKVFAVHLKPKFRDEIVADLERVDVPDLEVAVPGREYRFGGGRA